MPGPVRSVLLLRTAPLAAVLALLAAACAPLPAPPAGEAAPVEAAAPEEAAAPPQPVPATAPPPPRKPDTEPPAATTDLDEAAVNGGAASGEDATTLAAPQALAVVSPRQSTALPTPAPSVIEPGRLPTDPETVSRLRTRPPVAPPVDTAFDPPPRPALPPGTPPTAEAHCREAARAARMAVNRYLDLPATALARTDWAEEALRISEIAVRTCRDQPQEEAATYWRATALFLHGQYARAAINFRRVADMQGPFNALGYAGNLATLLQTCAEDRTGLDAFRLAGLYEAAGHFAEAAGAYDVVRRSRCPILRDLAESRGKLVADRLDAATPTR